MDIILLKPEVRGKDDFPVLSAGSIIQSTVLSSGLFNKIFSFKNNCHAKGVLGIFPTKFHEKTKKLIAK